MAHSNTMNRAFQAQVLLIARMAGMVRLILHRMAIPAWALAARLRASLSGSALVAITLLRLGNKYEFCGCYYSCPI